MTDENIRHIKFLDEYNRKMDPSLRRYKRGERDFMYDDKNALLCYVFKDDEEKELLGDSCPWRELDCQGLSRENWKENKNYWMDIYNDELDEEMSYLVADYMKYEYQPPKKESYNKSLTDFNIGELQSIIFNKYPDISEEDEDYINSLGYKELIAEIKNRGWEEDILGTKITEDFNYNKIDYAREISDIYDNAFVSGQTYIDNLFSKYNMEFKNDLIDDINEQLSEKDQKKLYDEIKKDMRKRKKESYKAIKEEVEDFPYDFKEWVRDKNVGEEPRYICPQCNLFKDDCKCEEESEYNFLGTDTRTGLPWGMTEEEADALDDEALEEAYNKIKGEKIMKVANKKIRKEKYLKEDYAQTIADMYDNAGDQKNWETIEELVIKYGVDFNDRLDQDIRNQISEEQAEDLYNEIVSTLGQLSESDKDPADEFIEFLTEALYGEDGVGRIETFEEAGLLTSNKGIVITYKGNEFQLSMLGYYK